MGSSSFRGERIKEYSLSHPPKSSVSPLQETLEEESDGLGTAYTLCVTGFRHADEPSLPVSEPPSYCPKTATLRRGDYGAVRGARWQALLPGPRRGLPGPHTSLSLYSCSQRSGLASAPVA